MRIGNIIQQLTCRVAFVKMKATFFADRVVVMLKNMNVLRQCRVE